MQLKCCILFVLVGLLLTIHVAESVRNVVRWSRDTLIDENGFTVEADTQLVIDPGVTVTFVGTAILAVAGSIKVVGTRDKRIKFVSKRGDRALIAIEPFAIGETIEFAFADFIEMGVEGYAPFSKFLFRNTFWKTDNAIFLINGTLRVIDSEFVDRYNSIILDDPSKVEFQNNRISYSPSQDSGADCWLYAECYTQGEVIVDGNYFSYGSTSCSVGVDGCKTVTIQNNNILNCGSLEFPCVIVSTDSSDEAPNVVHSFNIRNNTFDKLFGPAIEVTKGTIENNRFLNSIQSGSEGSIVQAIYVSKDDTDVVIRNNEFHSLNQQILQLDVLSYGEEERNVARWSFSNNEITNCKISDGRNMIHFDAESPLVDLQLVIDGNTFSNNIVEGSIVSASLKLPSSTILYGNKFLNNKQQHGKALLAYSTPTNEKHMLKVNQNAFVSPKGADVLCILDIYYPFNESIVINATYNYWGTPYEKIKTRICGLDNLKNVTVAPFLLTPNIDDLSKHNIGPKSSSLKPFQVFGIVILVLIGAVAIVLLGSATGWYIWKKKKAVAGSSGREQLPGFENDADNDIEWE